ncbi:hypothetical protein BKA64DRAFT_627225 [Cadophora sp. MPI-SDFR-AT-0126]|nr:hypothetical protein BKA64DRAFT_627225 [Leotiomycetes sp. MPI-SDFR-AT-0126]
MSSNNNASSTAAELRLQWSNPSDILSLLLLIGGDIVQKAIAQLAGRSVPLGPWKSATRVSIVPVAFSFGCVAYSFSNLLSAFGDKKLMPVTDCPSLTVNCSNGFICQNQSWVLGRLLRDHQTRHEVNPRNVEEGGRAESLRIDVFDLEPVSRCSLDYIWWLGWATIAAQIGIAIPPWYLYGNWGTILIVLLGNALVAITCAMPQWSDEKWAGRQLGMEKVTCLTGGNGFLHVMVFLGRKGSWDLERMAAGRSVARPETRFVSLMLAVSWTCLLISVSGLKSNSWFLVGIGGLGMLQNVFAAGAARDPSSSNIHITKSSRIPTIIGRRRNYIDDEDAIVNLDADLKELDNIDQWVAQDSMNGASSPTDVQMPPWLSTMASEDGAPEWLTTIKPSQGPDNEQVVYAVGVHGALMELEKWVPTAGLSMVQIFFPTGLAYADGSIRDNVHKRFWQRAYHTKSVRSKAERKRRAEEQSRQPI